MKGVKNARGQVSTELLIIVAVILVLFIPLLVISYFKANEVNEQIMQLQAQVVAMRLSELANSVGGSGGNSAIIAEVYVPASVRKIAIKSLENGGEITLETESVGGISDVSGLVRFPIKEKEFEFGSSGTVRFEITKDDAGVVNIERMK